jgi:RHS repeat-associated protein
MRRGLGYFAVKYYYRARYYDSSTGRFLSEDPAGFVGSGLNLYPYVHGNPASLSDPSGLWSPAAHRQMIWNALHPCHVSNEDIWQIQQGSEFIDDHFQGAEYAYMHYMTNGLTHQDQGAAVSATNAFVQHQMNEAADVLAVGGMSQAMFLLGTALHPLMDMTSPAHHDASGLPRPWCGFNPFGCSNLLEHALLEDVDTLDSLPDVQEREDGIIRSWYQVLTGKYLDCGCGGGKK